MRTICAIDSVFDQLLRKTDSDNADHQAAILQAEAELDAEFEDDAEYITGLGLEIR